MANKQNMIHRPGWVLHNSEATPVSNFKGIEPKDRPKVQCPGCHEDVIMKIGNEMPPHYAHIPGSWCNETALHLNSKMNLVEQLSRGSILGYSLSCFRGCGREEKFTLFRDWDTVRPEFTLGKIRPDVMLLKAGDPIGCIEVTHTHGIGLEKQEYLRKENLPTLELKASDDLCTWMYTPNIPLDSIESVMFIRNVSFHYHCEPCKEKEREEEREASKFLFEPLQIERKRLTLAACCWDVYMINGARYRESFQVCVELICGVVMRKWIEDKKGSTISSVDDPNEKSSHFLNTCLLEHIEKIIPKQRFDFIDHRQKWKKVNTKLSHLDARDHCRLRYKYKWDFNSSAWVDN